MANHLWKVTAKRDKMQVKKGRSVEIITMGAKPQLKEIVEAINAKYGLSITRSYYDSNSAFERDPLD